MKLAKQAFELLEVAPRSQTYKGMEGRITEGRELADEDIEDEILDAESSAPPSA